MLNFLEHGSKCDIIPSLSCVTLVLKRTIALQMMNSLSLHYMFSGASQLSGSLLSRSKLYRVCLLEDMSYCFILGRTWVFWLILPALWKLRICTCGWNLNMMERKWKAKIFLLWVILLLMWNLLSGATSHSFLLGQISDSVVSALVFELCMCVATQTKCYWDGCIVISCGLFNL